MDILLNNEINARTKEVDNSINDFINELRNSLENSKNKISIDRNFYDEIYNELELAPKYQNRLEDFSPVVNNNNPFFKKADFEITEGIPKYFEPDKLNRQVVL